MMSTEHEDIIDWHSEALAVINDVKAHVKSISVSEKLITDVGIYINVMTLEGKELTCFLDGAGFKIVGLSFDSCDEDLETYETIYSLIQSHSPGYTDSFGNALVDKLNKLS